MIAVLASEVSWQVSWGWLALTAFADTIHLCSRWPRSLEPISLACSHGRGRGPSKWGEVCRAFWSLGSEPEHITSLFYWPKQVMRPPTLKGWGNRIQKVTRHIARVIDVGRERIEAIFLAINSPWFLSRHIWHLIGWCQIVLPNGWSSLRPMGSRQEGLLTHSFTHTESVYLASTWAGSLILQHSSRVH